MSRGVAVETAVLYLVLAGAACGSGQNDPATPPPASASAATDPAPAPTPLPSASAPAPEPPGLSACDEAGVRKVLAASDGEVGCDALQDGTLVAAKWKVPAKGDAMSGTIHLFSKGKQVWTAPFELGGKAEKAYIERAEKRTFSVMLEKDGLVRVGFVMAAGEDYFSAAELVVLFESATSGKHVWTGVGSQMTREMDACIKEDVAAFRLDGGKIERTITPKATFTQQTIEAKLLAKLKKGCTAGKPKTEKFDVAK